MWAPPAFVQTCQSAARRRRRSEPIPRYLALQFALMLALRDGRRLQANGREPDINAILSWLRTNMPWVLLGYSRELENLYRRRLPELVASVDARRTEFTSR